MKTPSESTVILYGLIRRLPSQISTKLLENPEVQAKLDVRSTLRVGDAKVERDELISFLRDIEQKKPSTIKLGEAEIAGGSLEKDGSLLLEVRDQRFRFDEAGLFSRGRKRREAALKRLLGTAIFARAVESFWVNRVHAGPLNVAEFLSIQEVAQSTANGFRDGLRQALHSGEATIDHLVSTDRTYFESLFATNGLPGSYDDAVKSALREATERCTIPYFTHLAPMSVAPGFDITATCEKLNDDDAISLAERLVTEGDPFSMLAALELVCVRRSHSKSEQVGEAALKGLFGDGQTTSESIARFTAVLSLAIAVLDWKGPLKTVPVPVRRLAAFLHASQVVRVLRDFDVKDPDFYAWIQSQIATRLQLVVPLQRRFAPWWRLEWLQPALIEGYMRRRCEEVLSTIEESERPASWKKRIEFPNDRFVKDAVAVFSTTPGPFDEFEESWDPPQLPEEILGDVVQQLEKGGERAAVSALILTSRPHLKGRERKKISGLLARCMTNLEGEQLSALCHASLALSAVWRDAKLASAASDASLRLLQANPTTIRDVAVAIVSEAALENNEAAWSEKITSGFQRLGFMVSRGEPANALLDVIDKLSAFQPTLTEGLGRPRSTTLLAA